ncbi:hypothetical protein SDC9_160118 [bioreactor metagenome]|uniref:Uncharacterized protein n=1 Tax=bioreactor metagenome TaxID=1076179 RepID=A0A645FEH4_9ZZZZ
MKTKIFTSIFLLLTFLTTTSFISNYKIASDEIQGEVIWEGKNCDFYIIETRRYYVLVELYRGRLDKGDKVEGELHRYGFKYLKNLRTDSEIKVYIENYWSSKETCFEWLKDNNKCEFR